MIDIWLIRPVLELVFRSSTRMLLQCGVYLGSKTRFLNRARLASFTNILAKAAMLPILASPGNNSRFESLNTRGYPITLISRWRVRLIQILEIIASSTVMLWIQNSLRSLTVPAQSLTYHYWNLYTRKLKNPLLEHIPNLVHSCVSLVNKWNTGVLQKLFIYLYILIIYTFFNFTIMCNFLLLFADLWVVLRMGGARSKRRLSKE